MNEIVLSGCTPTPLASYLKALGVLRLISTTDSSAHAAWHNDKAVLQTKLTSDELIDFFLNQYQPTPILAPWNGGSGFYEKDNKRALQAIQDSTTPRLSLYRECLALADQVLSGVDRSSSPKDSAKAALLSKLRGLLPDKALDWFDASVLLSGESPKYPPLLGTGGNDGRLDFTNNFMQRLGEVLNLTGGELSEESHQWLRAALYGDPTPGLLKKAIGQFSPGQVGGPNATSGFEADSLINPWDFILMIEGALSFAAAAVRRNTDDPEGVLSYPFTVRAVGAGAGNLGEGDAAAARGELWMPLWRKWASYAEMRTLLAEGRVAFGRKPARDALNFARAVHRLGSYRGIDSFQRFGLLMRSGKAFLATPLARVVINDNIKTQWLDDLDKDDWLSRFRRFCQGDNVAKHFLSLRRQLEDRLFDLSGRRPTKSEAQTLLVLLGKIQHATARSQKVREAVAPIPLLSEQWVQAADDGTSAFRIARALAGLRGTSEAHLPLIAQLFPVHPRWRKWMEGARKSKSAGNDPACRLRFYTEHATDLCGTLINILQRRLWLAEQLHMQDGKQRHIKPLESRAGVELDDLLAFLRDPSMDRRIAALLPGFSLCRIPQDSDRGAGQGVVPAAFALLKLCMTPESQLRGLRLLGDDDTLPVPVGMVPQLASGNTDNRAVKAAWRRLHASGLPPLFPIGSLPGLGAIDPRRAAAALLLPLCFGAVGAMARAVLKAHESATA